MPFSQMNKHWFRYRFRCKRSIIAANLNQSTFSIASDTSPVFVVVDHPGERSRVQVKPVFRFNPPPKAVNRCLSPIFIGSLIGYVVNYPKIRLRTYYTLAQNLLSNQYFINPSITRQALH